MCPSFQGVRGTRAATDRDHTAPLETTPPMLQNMPETTMAMTMAILTTMTTILATTMVTMVTIVTMVITMDTVTVTEDDHTAAWEIIGKAPYIYAISNYPRYDYGSGYRNDGYSRSNPNIAKVSFHHQNLIQQFNHFTS